MDNLTTYNLAKKNKSPYIPIPADVIEAVYCVFKLYYNEKYVVIMGRTLFRQVEIVRENLARFFKNNGTVTHRSENSREDYCKMFYKYVYDNPKGKFRFEIIAQDEKPYRLLQKNQLALDEGLRGGNCLNLNWQPVVSRYLQTPNIYLDKWQIEYKEKYTWINRGHYLNFRKWQYNRNL